MLAARAASRVSICPCSALLLLFDLQRMAPTRVRSCLARWGVCFGNVGMGGLLCAFREWTNTSQEGSGVATLLVPCASRKAWPLHLVHAAEQTNVTDSLLARIGMTCNARGLRECNRGNEGEKHSRPFLVCLAHDHTSRHKVEESTLTDLARGCL